MTVTFRDYAAQGWALCAFAPGTKGPEGPSAKGWNTRDRAITSPDATFDMVQGGLLHAFSGTAALDIDNLSEARPYLAEHGIDVDALLQAPDSVHISSGRPNRAKLLYSLPSPLPSRKLCRYTSILDGLQYHALELRCGSRRGDTSVQDVLPPSTHPDTGRPYQWAYANPLVGHWSAPPRLPQALLDLWQAEGAPLTEEPPEAPTGLVERITSVAEITYLLSAIRADAYDDWLAVGMAIHHETGGSPEGLTLWDAWSRTSQKYGEGRDGRPPQLPADKWLSFTVSPHDRTIGTLRRMAVENGLPPFVAPEDFPVADDGEFQSQVLDAPAYTPSGMPEGPGEDTRPGAAVRRALTPLVFVSSQARYFDTREKVYLNEQGVDILYMAQMPLVPKGASGAAGRTRPSEVLRNVPWREDGGWREKVYSTGMHPGEGRFFDEGGLRYLNLFEPQTVEPLVPTASELEAFRFIWGRPDEQVFRDWLMNFFAYAVQKPGDKILMAPLLVGHETGSGKNTIMKVIPQLLFGKWHFTIMDSKVLQSSFNDQLADAWWVYFEELHSGTNKAERSALFNRVKPWVTDDTILVHPKGGKPFDQPNRLQVLGTSNYEDDALNLDGSDRRWCIGHIEKSMSDAEVRDAYGFLNSERAAGVLRHIFLNHSAAGFNPKGRAPETRAKRVMINVNYGTWESDILALIASGAAPFDKDIMSTTDILPFVKHSGLTQNKLARILKRAPFNFELLMPSGARRLWAWRNVESWQQIGITDRQDYVDGRIGRPHGWPWTDALPAQLSEACGLTD